MKNIIKFTVILASSFSLISCAGFFDKSTPVEQRSSKARGEKIENSESPVIIEQDSTKENLLAKEPEYGVEVSWEVPDESVDGYVLYSGDSKDVFDSELHLRIKDLKLTDDGHYSYIIAPVDPDKPLFIAIAAKKGESISEKSVAQEFSAKAKFQ